MHFNHKDHGIHHALHDHNRRRFFPFLLLIIIIIGLIFYFRDRAFININDLSEREKMEILEQIAQDGPVITDVDEQQAILDELAAETPVIADPAEQMKILQELNSTN